jgi:hypothetical protein
MKVLVKCGEKTKPPHTDEVNPGTCSRVKAFCLEKGEPTPDWNCYQHGGDDYPHQITKRMFDNCADAVKKLTGVPAAESEVYIKATGNSTYRKNKDGSYTGDISLSWSINRSASFVAGLEISWPNMSAADKAAVKEVQDALEAHEQGHFHIAEEYLQELNGGGKITVTAATKEAAEKKLKAQVADKISIGNTELANRQKEYDDLTNHGVDQSKVGGKDVKLKCPPATK